MVKRIIDGKAYNTATAAHIATAHDTYNDDQNRGHTVDYDLYRTQGGAFFLVLVDHLDDDEERRPEVAFYPAAYDTAHAFASGQSFQIGYSTFGAQQVDLLEDGIFPTVPEATDEGKDVTATH